jgi:hypothetical protein
MLRVYPRSIHGEDLGFKVARRVTCLTSIDLYVFIWFQNNLPAFSKGSFQLHVGNVMD